MPAHVISSVLTTPAPSVSAGIAEGIAREHYGLKARARALVGERDSNFRLSSSDGREFLLKLANPAENAQLADFQTQALLHLALRDPSLPIPRVIETLNGESFFVLEQSQEAARIVRMVTFLSGTPLADVERSPSLPRNLGIGLARLDLALADFTHPTSSHELLWDLSHAVQLRPLIGHIDGREARAQVESVLDRLETQVFPDMTGMRRQVIHNDFNPSNILVSGGPEAPQDRLAGIIDFGDMVEAPLINEVAVAASYHVAIEGDFLAPIKALLGGYHSVLPLEDREIDILFDLVLARMAQSIVIPAWRCTLEPGNRDYILRNAERARMGLKRAQALSPTQAAEEFHSYLARERAR